MNKLWKRFRKIAAQLKQDLKALRVALADDLVPWYIKILIIFTVAYALSPIDLIPDFIPVLGLLDDLILLPVMIFVIIKFIPKEVMTYCRKEAGNRKFSRKSSFFAGVIVVLIWLLLLFWLLDYFFPGILAK